MNHPLIVGYSLETLQMIQTVGGSGPELDSIVAIFFGCFRGRAAWSTENNLNWKLLSLEAVKEQVGA